MAGCPPGFTNVLTFIGLVTWGPLLVADTRSAIFVMNSSGRAWTLTTGGGNRTARNGGILVVKRFHKYRRIIETEFAGGFEESIAIESHKIIMVDFKPHRSSTPCGRLWQLVDSQGNSRGNIAYVADPDGPTGGRLVGPSGDPVTAGSDIANRVHFGLKSVEITADSW
jgi:hypothetical protein